MSDRPIRSHKDGGVHENAVPHRLLRKCVTVILANAAQRRLTPKQLFKSPFVFDEHGEIAFGTELPAHVASGP
jgi:hypothetical protein